jgi:hypothetical protein
MAVAPEGKWFCADCQSRRDAVKRGNRSGKRKTGGGRKDK